MYIGRRLMPVASRAQHVYRANSINRQDGLLRQLYLLRIQCRIDQFLHGLPTEIPADLRDHDADNDRCQ